MTQLTGGEDDVLQHGFVFEEVERLEHHAHLLAQPIDGIALGEDVLAIDDDTAVGRLLQQVQTAQESTLARARGTDDGDDLSTMDIHIDVTQYVKARVAFLQVRDAEKEVGCPRLDVCRLRVRVCTAFAANK